MKTTLNLQFEVNDSPEAKENFQEAVDRGDRRVVAAARGLIRITGGCPDTVANRQLVLASELDAVLEKLGLAEEEEDDAKPSTPTTRSRPTPSSPLSPSSGGDA